MAFDTIALGCITQELKNKIIGARVEKVYQPEKDEVELRIRSLSDSYRLTISASPTNPRIHFSQKSKSNPDTPPMFCMLMRKHLTSGKITAVSNPGFDRVIMLDIESYNELGDLTVKHLVAEIMGRHSNIILTNDDMTVIDSVKHIDFTMSSVRQVLPGGKYSPPPEQEKTPILSDDIAEFSVSPPEGNMRLDKLLLSQVGGISPLSAREIVYRAFGRCDILSEGFCEWEKLSNAVRDFAGEKFKPCIVFEKESGRTLDFSAVDIKQYQDAARIEYFCDMSTLLERFYSEKDSTERMKQKSADVVKILSNNITRTAKKINILRATLEDAKNKEKHKKYGDLLTANLYAVVPGAPFAEVVDYYSPTMEKTQIPLKKNLSPAQNAQRYYKLYNKAKTAETEAAAQLKNAAEDLEYLESTLSLAKNCTSEADIRAIREELGNLGYIKLHKNGKKQKQEVSKPHHYVSSDGFDIYVGKNNTQNDKLTLKFANSSDIWFHTKKIHGSHVIIKLGVDKDVQERTLREAAELAAFYSKARESSRVPVDYTEVRNVKKPNGAKPGMVIYDSYNTIYVNPKVIDEK